jgi:hypothetical protein
MTHEKPPHRAHASKAARRHDGAYRDGLPGRRYRADISSFMTHRRLLCLLFVAACAPELPSSTPLGSGPLADRGAGGSRPVASAKLAALGSSEAGAVRTPAPPITKDAGADAAVDAGAADAATDAGKTAPAPDAAPAKLAVAGEYTGEDVTVMRLPPMPDRREEDPKARIDVTQPSPDAVVFGLINSADGRNICSLKAKLIGSAATIEGGQRCEAFSAIGRLDRGSATFAGETLTLELHGSIEFEGADQTFKGNFEYRFNGKRR